MEKSEQKNGGNKQLAANLQSFAKRSQIASTSQHFNFCLSFDWTFCIATTTPSKGTLYISPESSADFLFSSIKRFLKQKNAVIVIIQNHSFSMWLCLAEKKFVIQLFKKKLKQKQQYLKTGTKDGNICPIFALSLPKNEEH